MRERACAVSWRCQRGAMYVWSIIAVSGAQELRSPRIQMYHSPSCLFCAGLIPPPNCIGASLYTVRPMSTLAESRHIRLKMSTLAKSRHT